MILDEGDPLSLSRRAGWPDDLLFLYRKYPREVWQRHANLGEVARFWLDRHGMFRELNEGLRQGADMLREGKVPAKGFRPWFAPRFAFFLQELHAHHHIEDYHYFPVFHAAEKRLAKGFDILENDHQMIDLSLRALKATGQTFEQALTGNRAKLEGATVAMAEALGAFLVTLDRHLADEEDLIVPVILDRGELSLGIG